MHLRQFTTVEDWSAWVNKHEWDIFGTLNFTQHHKPSLQHADKLWRLFWNKIDRAVYGKRVQYGDRVERTVFIHLGANSANPHIHFVAKSPIDRAQFCILLNAVWAGLCNGTASPVSNELMPVINQQRAIEYMLHDHWRIGSDTFSTSLTHFADIGFDPKTHNNAFERIAERATDTWLRQANQAYDTHQLTSQERYKLLLVITRGTESGVNPCSA